MLESGREGLAAVAAKEVISIATSSQDAAGASASVHESDDVAVPAPMHKGTCHCGEVSLCAALCVGNGFFKLRFSVVSTFSVLYLLCVVNSSILEV